MFDVWRVVQWWDAWQLRILVLGSLAIQWFLLVAAPMRKYTIPRLFRTLIWLAYVSSDALAIYALATLFNRHAKATTSSSSCGGIIPSQQGSILEVLWAPVLLIHLGGQEEMTAYTIEDNELWTRHAVTLVSQVAIALYAFYKSWLPSSDWKLLASAILLFIIGVVSFSEKPWALKKASINRLASVSATIQGTKSRSKWGIYFDDLMFSDWYKFFSKPSKDDPADQASSSSDQQPQVVLSDGDKVYMILSDMSLLATAYDLVQRGRAKSVEEVLPMTLGTNVKKELKRWLRGSFGFIYTRANVVVHPVYLTYHLVVVPALHIAALTLFATSDKRGYSRTDVKTTYVLLCFTAALDVLAVFIRQLLYKAMAMADCPALCETVPGYNLMEAALRRARRDTGWLVRLATRSGCKEEYFDCGTRGVKHTAYKMVSALVTVDLSGAKNRDLASYRVFTEPEPSEVTEIKREETVNLTGEAPSTVDVETIEIKHPEIVRLTDAAPSPPVPVDVERADIIQLPSYYRSTESSSCWSNTTVVIDHQLQHAEARGPPAATFRYHHTTSMGQHDPRGFSLSNGGGSNWALDLNLQRKCGPEARMTLRGSFDTGVVVWHIATDLLFRMDPPPPNSPRSSGAARSCKPNFASLFRACAGRKKTDDDESSEGEDPSLVLRKCAASISDYMAHLLKSRPEMLLTGSRQHLASEAMEEVERVLKDVSGPDHGGQQPSKQVLSKIIHKYSAFTSKMKDEHGKTLFHVPKACRLAKELLTIPDDDNATRWTLIYRVWLGMLCYSASMCRGYLHAKSLGEGGEFLSFIWLVLSLRGTKTLADKLQMP